MKIVWLYFLLRKKLGLAKIGQPPRAPARPSSRDLRGLELEEMVVDGFTVYRVKPEGVKRRVVFLHGGGYVQPIAKQHWQLITFLAKKANAEFLVPLYGLSPKYKVDDALRLLHDLREILDSRLPICLMGDSAGGGLALSIAQNSWTDVEKLILISPWVSSDFGPETDIYEKRDPWLNPESLKYIATIWSGQANRNRKEVSPLLGEMGNLPTTTIFAGDYELFFPQLQELYRKILSSGVNADLYVQEGGLHVFPLIPSREGRNAKLRLVRELEGQK
ncbi:MAG: alpha/beta fold hydrolase [bacterium]